MRKNDPEFPLQFVRSALDHVAQRAHPGLVVGQGREAEVIDRAPFCLRRMQLVQFEYGRVDKGPVLRFPRRLREFGNAPGLAGLIVIQHAVR